MALVQSIVYGQLLYFIDNKSTNPFIWIQGTRYRSRCSD